MSYGITSANIYCYNNWPISVIIKIHLLLTHYRDDHLISLQKYEIDDLKTRYILCSKKTLRLLVPFSISTNIKGFKFFSPNVPS